MMRCVTSRDAWQASQETGYLGQKAQGQGWTISGRKVTVSIDTASTPQGVLEADAPGSQGGFLKTLIGELLSGEDRINGGAKPSPLTTGLIVDVDGKPVTFDWQEAGGIWWWQPVL